MEIVYSEDNIGFFESKTVKYELIDETVAHLIKVLAQHTTDYETCQVIADELKKKITAVAVITGCRKSLFCIKQSGDFYCKILILRNICKKMKGFYCYSTSILPAFSNSLLQT